MGKILKWGGGILGVLIIAVIIALTVINPDQFKPQIEQYVSRHAGRVIQINGPISWKIFPSVGIALRKVVLMNPKGYPNKPTASIGEVGLSAQLWPLLSGKFKVGVVSVQNASLNIIKKSDGATNLDGLINSSGKTVHSSAPDVSESAPVKDARSESSQPLSLALKGVDLSQIVVSVHDQATDSSQLFTLDSLKLGKFAPGLGLKTPLSLAGQVKLNNASVQFKGHTYINVDAALKHVYLTDTDFKVNGQSKLLPQGKTTVQLQSQKIELNLDRHDLSAPFKLDLDKINSHGVVAVNWAVKPQLNFELAIDQLDLNPYLPKQSKSTKEVSTTQSSKNEPSQKTSLSDQEPDLNILQMFDANVKLSVKQLIYQKATMGPMNMVASLKDGVVRVHPFNIDLYKGYVKATTVLNSNKEHPLYQGKVIVKNIQIRPLLKDFTQFDQLVGTTQANIDFSGQGLSEKRLMQLIRADGQISIKDGAYYGVDLPALIRNGLNRIKGKSTSENKRKTDFSSLDMIVSKRGLIVTNKKLQMISPLLQLHGHGQYFLENNKVNYQLAMTLSDSFIDKNSNHMKLLKGVSIPLVVSGYAPDALNYKVKLDQVIKAQAERVTKEKLKKERHKLEDKLRDALKDKFKLKF